jgi:hypothetical protein
MSYFAHFTSPGRPVGNIKVEIDRAVSDFASHHSSIVIDVNSSMSSQILVDSFRRQQIPFISKGNTLPSGSAYLHGIYGPTIGIRNVNNKHAMYYLDSKWSVESINQRAYELEFPENKIISIGKNSFAYLLSILTDPMYQGFVYSSKYLEYNHLKKSNGDTLVDTEFWTYYVSPLLVANYWGDTVHYQNSISDSGAGDFSKDTVFVNFDIFVKFLSKSSVSNLRLQDNSNLLTH